MDLSLSLKEGPGMIELVNEGFSQVKDSIQNVEQRIGLRPKHQNDKKFPELKFRPLGIHLSNTIDESFEEKRIPPWPNCIWRFRPGLSLREFGEPRY